MIENSLNRISGYRGQLSDNRKSTGPRTGAGKAAFRFYSELRRPANPGERFLADALIHNEWFIRRMRRAEAELWIIACGKHAADNPGHAEAPTAGDAFSSFGGPFERLQRIVNSRGRNFHRAPQKLRAVQAARTAERPAQPEESKATSASSASFRNQPKRDFGTSPLPAELRYSAPPR
jgi:hypothetical protein